MGHPITRLFVMTTVMATSLGWSGEGPAKEWPRPVSGFAAPQAGEHPRLFFRKADLPEIKRRAETPEGRAIVNRLRFLLDGKEGKGLPEIIPAPAAGAKGASDGKALTLWHPAGYGMLYHLTGDATYAETGKQAMERILTNAGDIDPRYGFVRPNGALRAGPSLGAVAMGYDLCYDGWDDAFRKKTVEAILKGPGGFPLDALVLGKRHGPHSNHWGCQIGGGALAILAVWKDPGADNARIETLMQESKKDFIRQLTEGFGDGGMFHEGKGPGGIGSDTAFIPAIQAWRVAGGQDFVSPRPHAAAVTMIKVHELLRINGEPWYLIPVSSGYGSGYFGPADKGGIPSDRNGLSRGGQFAQGFGAIPEKLKPAALWTFNRIVEPDPAARIYDTVSAYPHRAVLALVNWPVGVKEVNPAERIPRVHVDERLGLYAFRNQWTGTDDDIVVNATHRARDPHGFMVWGKGQRRIFGACPKGDASHFQAAEDGSGTLTVGSMLLGVDFSKASGADGLIVTVGLPMSGAKQIQAGGRTFHLLLLGGKPAEPAAQGDKVVAGKQEIGCDGNKIAFSVMSGPPKWGKLGCW
jgi:hypothetical protein